MLQPRSYNPLGNMQGCSTLGVPFSTSYKGEFLDILGLEINDLAASWTQSKIPASR